jgi:hypothetical protein
VKTSTNDCHLGCKHSTSSSDSSCIPDSCGKYSKEECDRVSGCGIIDEKCSNISECSLRTESGSCKLGCKRQETGGFGGNTVECVYDNCSIYSNDNCIEIDGCGIINNTCRNSSECKFELTSGSENGNCLKGCKKNESTSSCEYDTCKTYLDLKDCLLNDDCGIIDNECEDQDNCKYINGDNECRDGCVNSSLGCLYDICGGYTTTECVGINNCKVVNDICSPIIPVGGCGEIQDTTSCVDLDGCDLFGESKCSESTSFVNNCDVIGQKSCLNATRYCVWDDTLGCSVIKKEEDGRWNEKSKTPFPWWIIVIVGL